MRVLSLILFCALTAVFVIGESENTSNNDITINFDLVWHEANCTQPYLFTAKSNVTEGLQNAEKIEILNKTQLGISVDLSFARQLKVLVVDNVGLVDISKVKFESLPNTIKNVSVTGNEIRHINRGVFGNMLVQRLNLSYNRIQTIAPEAFDNLTQLSTIILDHNELTSYHIQFNGCKNLHLVSLQYNFVKELPEGAFRALKDNVLTVLFSYNRIKEVHKLAFDIKDFKEVHLDHNELSDAKLLIKLIKADKVDLSDNHISCLPKEFMENGLSKIKVLNLTANPLNCSCYNDLKKKVRKNIEFQKMSPLVKNITIVLPDIKCNKKK